MTPNTKRIERHVAAKKLGQRDEHSKQVHDSKREGTFVREDIYPRALRGSPRQMKKLRRKLRDLEKQAIITP